MAKKKAEKNEEKKPVETDVRPTEGQVEETPVEDKVDNVSVEEQVENAPTEEQVEETPVEDKEEIPEFVHRILKIFSNYEMLYVARNGGTYTKDTQPEHRRDAILYKNPYFTNNKNKK